MPFTQYLDRALSKSEQQMRTSEPIVLSREEIRQLRLRAQRLHPQAAPGAGAAEVVRAVGGVQAQAPTAARLAVRTRSRGLTDDDVERARVRERSLIRTWGPRGTL